MRIKQEEATATCAKISAQSAKIVTFATILDVVTILILSCGSDVSPRTENRGRRRGDRCEDEGEARRTPANSQRRTKESGKRRAWEKTCVCVRV